MQLGRAIYSTSRLLGIVNEQSSRGGSLSSGIGGAQPSIEWPTDVVRTQYEPLGLKFLKWSDSSWVTAALERAFEVISHIDTLSRSIGAVVARVHPLRAPNADEDVSYSDPRVPFSIFIGVHEGSGTVHDLRLAEGIVHEAMHLQLSLVEKSLPLIAYPDATAYSPWRVEQRPLTGVLHGAYVFRCIFDFYGRLAPILHEAPEVQTFCARRRTLIREQIASAIGDQVDNLGFTPAGRILASILLQGMVQA